MKSSKRILIMIPARGGSKGLPRKNLRELGGKSLLAWTWDAVKAAGLDAHDCVLTTDDAEIAVHGRQLGIPVPFERPPELATDTASLLDVALHALDWLKSKKGYEADALLLLQPTSPFRDPSDLKLAFKLLDGADAVVGVKPIRRTLATLFKEDAATKLLEPVDAAGLAQTRRQDVQDLFTPNGALYLCSVEALRRERTFFPSHTRGLVMNQVASIDIDDEVDWRLAEGVAAGPLSFGKSAVAKRVYIIAEAGVNHNGSLERALELVDLAARAGADAVKFQTFKATSLVSRAAPKAEYQKKSTRDEGSQLEMLKKLELSAQDHEALIKRCRERGIEFLSSPFDSQSLRLLVDTLKLLRLKLGSGELTNAPLVLEATRSGLPLILSTGMSTLQDVEAALKVAAFGYLGSKEKPSLAAFDAAYSSKEGRKLLAERVALLHCTTEYPAPFDEANLRAIETLRQAFGLEVGFSDHTPGLAIPVAAVARGATIVEKHFTLDKSLPGPDHKASLAPQELEAMVQAIRQVEQALGDGVKKPALSELKNVSVARKSLVAATTIRKGEPFTERNLTIKRPGGGVEPLRFWEWLGKFADRDYQEDELIQ